MTDINELSFGIYIYIYIYIYIHCIVFMQENTFSLTSITSGHEIQLGFRWDLRGNSFAGMADEWLGNNTLFEVLDYFTLHQHKAK